MADVLLIARVNLVLQIIMIIMLGTSYIIKRRHRFFIHGSIMTAAVVLNAFSFFLVMGPSLLGYADSISLSPLNRISILLIVHATLGSIAEILGGWLIVSWHLQTSIQGCIRKKPIMRITIILWITALTLGFLLYTLLYTTLS